MNQNQNPNQKTRTPFNPELAYKHYSNKFNGSVEAAEEFVKGLKETADDIAADLDYFLDMVDTLTKSEKRLKSIAGQLPEEGNKKKKSNQDQQTRALEILSQEMPSLAKDTAEFAKFLKEENLTVADGERELNFRLRRADRMYEEQLKFLSAFKAEKEAQQKEKARKQAEQSAVLAMFQHLSSTIEEIMDVQSEEPERPE
jgi:septal ring factor EnvC (AmiA/AmiB activator)